MTSALGLTKYQELALNKHLSVGGAKYNGTLINAVLHNGFQTNFQGVYMTNEVAATGVTVASRLTVDADLDPYVVQGVSQLMTLRSSDATPSATAGFPDAAAAADTGVLRLTNRDVNGANAVAMCQDNALWIAPSNSFTAIFDVAQWSERALPAAMAYSEFGVVGTVVVTDVYNSARVLGYVDGSLDKTSVMIKLFGNSGRIVYKPNALALPASASSAVFEIPAGKFTARLEYVVPSMGGVPSLTLYINERNVVSLNVTLTGPLQLAARSCHGASYVAATMVPPVLDIDAIIVANV